MNLIVELLRHNTMMNTRLVEACRKLTPEQLEATVQGTYGTIGATLAHIADAQVGYIPRFIAADRPEPIPEVPSPGFEAIAERMAYGNALLEEAAALVHEDHDIEVTGDDPPGTWRMPAALLLLQAVNHGTDHRSQIATILTQVGEESPEMDGWTFFFDRGHMRAI